MQSATYDNAGNVPLPVDHSGLNKYAQKDANYRLIVARVPEVIEPIALKKQQPLYSVTINMVGTYTEREKLSAAVTECVCMHHEKASVPHALAI